MQDNCTIKAMKYDFHRPTAQPKHKQRKSSGIFSFTEVNAKAPLQNKLSLPQLTTSDRQALTSNGYARYNSSHGSMKRDDVCPKSSWQDFLSRES
jgi:hypothetical protein